jgi:cysteinylglycine-S-conjugate dipeptidase
MGARLSQKSIPWLPTSARPSRGTILITAVGDPDSRAHGANESLHLGDFVASCPAEILMLDAFAQLDPEG